MISAVHPYDARVIWGYSYAPMHPSSCWTNGCDTSYAQDNITVLTEDLPIHKKRHHRSLSRKLFAKA